MANHFDPAAIQARYQGGSWRGFVFRDLVLDDIAKLKATGREITALDIGCGHGFDGHPDPQKAIGAQCTRFIGIEPDTDIKIPEFFSDPIYALLETANLAPDSIDIAYAVMVLEHVENPTEFMRTLHTCMRHGGVFWGFTVDSRHWFASASNTLAKLKLKDKYLSFLHGARGEERYENYPVAYKLNTLEDVRRYAGAFKKVDVVSLYKWNQTHYYFPKGLRWVGNALDVVGGWFGRRGSVLVIRLEK
jgi:SAM-dependent methyltransferase